MEHLKELESKSIYIIREAYKQFKDIAMLWSIGKDSTALLHICRKAFYGKIPFPIIHLDTSYKFKEIYEFRDRYAKEWGLNLIIGKNEDALSKGVNPDTDKLTCCTQLKTEALKQVVAKHNFKALLLGIRRDEHGVRAKERVFCFPEDMLVYGEKIKQIKDVKKGDFIFTHLGSLKEVLGVSSSYYEGDLLVITPKYGMPVTMTPNHIIFAKVAGKGKRILKSSLIGFDGVMREVEMTLKGRRRISWVNAFKLKKGDLLFIPKLPKKPQDGIKTLRYIRIKKIIGDVKGLVKTQRRLYWKSAHKSAGKIRESLPLSPDMLRIIGYYSAEGSANLSANQISFAFGSHERHFVEDVLKTIKKNFNIKGNVRKRGNSFEIIFSSKIFVLLFLEMCGKGARNKKLPNFFTVLSVNQLTELVKGCWRGDGSNECYSTMSKQLAHQLRLALLRLGVLTSIKRDKGLRYHLKVAGTSKSRFTELFGIECVVPYIQRCGHTKEITSLSSKKLSEIDYGKSCAGGFWIPIEKIEKKPYKGFVHDLSIDKHSSYLVEGLSVHNSPRNTDFQWNYKDQPPELWDYYKSKQEGEQHIRVHPMLHWTELDIWKYVKKENIPIIDLYFAKGNKRYRSIGCETCCNPIESNANDINKIIEELEITKIAERSGRAQDKERAYTMQRLRSLGYM